MGYLALHYEVSYLATTQLHRENNLLTAELDRAKKIKVAAVNLSP